MKNLIRKATLLSACALITAGAAYAGAPSAANSTKPVGIRLVGTNGFGANPADSKGNVIFTIRDAVPNVIPNAQVTLNFGGCPHIRICQNGTAQTTVCVGPNGQGTVTGTTDVNGQVAFSIVGSVDQTTYVANQNFPEPDVGTCPGAGNQGYFGCATVTVTAPGFPPAAYPNVISAAFDHELVAGGVGSGDLSRAVTDVLSGNYRERTDYNTSVAAGGAGCLNSADVSELIAVALGGGSTNSCTPGQGGTPCP
jgi:hypothetical protein